MTDIRLGTDFLHHPKIRKLQRRLGPEGIVSLLALWCFAGERRQTGKLDDMDAEDIAIAADWAAEPATFVDALVDLRLVDVDADGVLSVHSWEEHQGWIIHAPARKAKAKRAAAARWGSKEGRQACSEHTTSMPDALHSDATSNAPSPTPTPTPSPTQESNPNGLPVGRGPTDHCPHQAIIDLYHEILPMCPAVRSWTKQREQLLRQRWREDTERQCLDWWKRYFTYVAGSKFLTGSAEAQGGRQPFIADLEWLVRPSNLVKVVEGKYHHAA